MFEGFKKYSIKDGLTNSFNRRKFNLDIVNEINRAKRYQKNFSLLIIDIDWFKKYNDFHGNKKGDSILKKLVILLKNETQDSDNIYRFGGEEFAIFLPETWKKQAIELAERLRKSVEIED